MAYISRFSINQTQLNFFDVQFEITDESQEIELLSTNLVQILASVGGLAGSIFVIIKFVVDPVQNFIYYQTIIKQTYLVDSTVLNNKYQEERDKISEMKQHLPKNQFDLHTSSKGEELQGKTQSQNINTFFLLIQKLLQRNPFSYSPIFAFGTYIKSLILCRKYSHQEIYRTGKEMIEKQLDIRIMLRDLRTYKMSNNLLLTKFQRRLIPFLQPYLLNKKLESKEKKEEENKKLSKEEVIKKFQNEKLSNLIEFFANYQKKSNDVDKVMFDQLMQDEAQDIHNLEVQLYSGILRQYVVNNLKQIDEKSIIKPADSKVKPNKSIIHSQTSKALQLGKGSDQFQQPRQNSLDIGPNEIDDKKLFSINDSNSYSNKKAFENNDNFERKNEDNNNE
ncbi:UNKNOWN [Stylonychia lemnae]|uniref:Uncharacterized protein n=1 Tax=Stylonychia lemnae TaxID=5949 RepID=A0A078AJ75_STYLE|nr:UNKNOWN [Stylonychia lemnae]|eukprot:CDW80853.1 UNKNOWN [Stylonychia lemnae]